MITLRRADQRGSTKLSWLDSRHTFSFGDYHDQKHMGFGSLRVINEDRVNPGGGFPTHSHRDMEIITYVLEGAVAADKDSTGTSTVIRPGDVQRMSAGTGISHSEYNSLQNEPVHFLQIWIIPDEMGLVPGYEQKAFSLHKQRGTGTLVASKDGRDGSITGCIRMSMSGRLVCRRKSRQFFTRRRIAAPGYRWRAVPECSTARSCARGTALLPVKKRSWRSRLLMTLSF